MIEPQKSQSPLFLITCLPLPNTKEKAGLPSLIGSPAIIATNCALTRDFATHPLEMVCPWRSAHLDSEIFLNEDLPVNHLKQDLRKITKKVSSINLSGNRIIM
jgi:hypothetical protein